MGWHTAIYPGQYSEVKGALEFAEQASSNSKDKHVVRRLLKDLEGIGEIGRGRPRHMNLSDTEAKMLRDVSEAFSLNLRVMRVVKGD